MSRIDRKSVQEVTMVKIKSIAGALAVFGSILLVAACGGSQTNTAATDASGQPEEDSPPMSSGGSGKSHDTGSSDSSVGDVRVSSAFGPDGEPIPGSDGDISPDAKRPPKQAASAAASASAAPATTPPKKGGKK